MSSPEERLAAAPVYTRKERRRIATLDRRARFLEERSDGRSDLTRDLQEAAAIRWVLATLDAERAANPVAAVDVERREWLEATAREADQPAPVVHDFITPRANEDGRITHDMANDAIWTIHRLLRPLYASQVADLSDVLPLRSAAHPDKEPK